MGSITASFNIRVSGAIEYHFEDKIFIVNEGKMIYMPKGSEYIRLNIFFIAIVCLIILQIYGILEMQETDVCVCQFCMKYYFLLIGMKI